MPKEFRIRSGAVPRVVLVVDDEPDVLEILAAMLEDLGCEVVTATQSEKALEKLAADPRIELLFTDIEMPVMDGYELAEKAKRVRNGLRVIVTSGRAQERTDLPMVHKPFGTEALARMMEETTGLC
jgi:two-component system cell cycle response regulator CpdR